MVDSEIIMAEATKAGYASATRNSSGYGDTTSNVAPETGVYTVENARDLAVYAGVAADGGYTATTGTILSERNTCGMDSGSVSQEARVGSTYKAMQVVGMSGNSENIVVAMESDTVLAAQPADYNSSANGNASIQAGSVTSGVNENAVTVVGGAAADQQSLDGSVSTMSAEEERLWSIVRASSLDFDAWTALIDETEKVAENNILKIRNVYDAFLAEFPLCYGYWKKYADHEARLGSVDKVVEVYEQAVLGVTYSVDIWLHYCIFSINTYGDPDIIRRLFERGLAYVGTDYLSYPIWDKYIEYEEMHAEWGHVAVIYTRVLEIPNRKLDDYFNRFKIFAASRPLSELRTAEEAAAAAPLSKDSGGANEGEVRPDTAEQSSKPVSAGLAEAVELEKYIAFREEIYKKAKEFDSKICDFENAIRRPYFHVRPLNVSELENWHNYLDFIEKEDLNKVVKLYERCLIACANYPEYWIRYVLCMEAYGSMDLATNALTRATQIFVKKQPEIHLFAARFREQCGDIPGARAAYQHLHTEITPCLLEAIIKHANMECRLGNLEDAFSLYEQAITIEKGKEHSQLLPMLYAQYARFVCLVSGNAEKTREILVQAFENVQLSKPLLEAFIHIESIQTLPKRIDYLDSLVDKFIVSDSDSLIAGSASEREELSCIFLEFLGIFGDAQSIKKAEDRHAKFFLPHRSKSELKKHHAENYLASDKSKIAKAYFDASSPAQSLIGAYPTTQNQWATVYGAQPQPWPPVAQPQMQQWTSQQAAYGTYGGYGSGYPAPQAPTSVAYPPTYPTQQSYAQQSYAQPPAAQPASVPQPYLGSYY